LDTLERVLQAAASIPVIIMTGVADETMAVRAVQAGAQDYLLKGSVDGQTLTRAIRYAIERKRGELHLRELAAIVDNSTDVIFRKDLQGIIRSWNKGAEQVYGYEASEVIGQPVSMLMPPKSVDQMTEIMERVRKGEKVERFETERIRKDGTRIIVSLTVSPISDNQGQVIAASTIAHDITEKRRAEEAVQHVQDRFRALTENAPDGVALVDLNGFMQFVSPAGRRIFGYGLEEEIDFDPAEHTHPEDLPGVLAAIEALIENPAHSPTLQYRFRHRHGSWRWIESTFTNLLHLPSVEAIVINFRDITDRQQAEEALHNSEMRLNNIVSNASEAILVINDEEQITFYNKAAQKAFGWSEEEIIGRPLSLLIPPRFAGHHHEYVQSFSTSSQTAHTMESRPEPTCLHKDGREFASTVGISKHIEGGRMFFTAIVQDITEKKQTEISIREKVVALETLGEIQRELNAATEAMTILDLLCQRIAGLIHVPKVAIAVRDISARMQLSAQHGLEEPSLVDGEFLSEWDHGFFRAQSAQRQTVAISQIAKDLPILPSFRAREHIEAMAISPLYNGERITGALVVFDTGPRDWTDDELQMLDLLAGQAAIALEKIRLLNEEKQRRAELTALYHLSAKLGESNDFNEVLRIVVNNAVELLHITFARILLLEENEFVVCAHHPVRDLPIDLALPSLPVDSMPYSFSRLTNAEAVVIDTRTSGIGEPERNILLLDHAQSLCLIPLKIRNLPLGVLVLGEARSQSREPFHENKLRLATSIGEQTSSAIQRTQLYKQTEQRLLHLQALTTIDHAISSSFDLKLVLNILTQQAKQQLEIDCVAAHLFDPVTQQLEYVAGAGLLTEEIANYKLGLGEGLLGSIALSEQMRLEPDLARASGLRRQPLILKEGFISYCGAPLIAKGKLVGVLEAFHRSSFKFTQEWVGFYKTLAGQAAIAIDNAQLLASLQRSNLELERRVAERTAELNRTNAELEQANRAKDEFLATMSHELRTPLNSILGLSESLLEQRRGSLNEHQERSLQIVETSGRHLLDLINDILDLSKIEAGKLDYYPQPVLVDELCRSCLGFIKSQAARKSITVTYQNEASIARLFADPRRLKQILVNLLSNAVKFTPEHGQVTLQVQADAQEDLIRFSVLDTGIGISTESQMLLFQPFVQVDSSLNREFQGTGLGLFLVQKLVDMHGGSVHVESEVDRGSRFTVNLPWGRKSLSDSVSLPSASEPSEESPVSSAEVPLRRRILLAEDNMASALTVGEYLESHGYLVQVAHDGLEVTQLASETVPDLILMDIQMPVMNGLEAIHRLRAHPQLASIPIIALTALAMSGDRERCMEAGADEYMSKPVPLKKLLSTIKEMLRSKA
ncbi:MAG: PAS domain S-box protein, partial [Chloroflexota bacterium]|nr:PAS domain S-box protein [Chloroflexota bacterium]